MPIAARVIRVGFARRWKQHHVARVNGITFSATAEGMVNAVTLRAARADLRCADPCSCPPP